MKAASNINANGFKIANLADPTSSQDATTKNYVDTVAQGLSPRMSARVATTANITLSGTQTIDGYALAVGDRVIVKNQTTPSQNGIYVVNSGTWARSSDADTWNELVAAFLFTEVGSTQADQGFLCTVDIGGTLNSTAVNWTKFGGGNVDLASSNVSGVLPVSKGGTETTTVLAYKQNNGIPTAGQVSNVATAANTEQSYSFNSLNIGSIWSVLVQDLTTLEVVYPDVRMSGSTVYVTFGSAVSANSYQIKILGF